MGGTGRLVAGLVEADRRAGRQRALRSPRSREITVERRRAVARGVRLADGETIAADIVVSNADSAWTYRHLLAPQHRRRWTDRRIDAARYSMGLFVWYFGTRRQYPEVRAPHDPARAALSRAARATSSSARCWPTTSASTCTGRRRPIRRSRRPAATRSTCSRRCRISTAASTGASAPSPTAGASQRHLEQTLLPGLSEQVVTSRMLTPQDFQDELSSFRGAAFGLEPVLTQSAWFRPHNRSEEVDGSTSSAPARIPGAGLPGVLSSARVLDKVVPACARTAPERRRRRAPTSRPAAPCSRRLAHLPARRRCCCRAACASPPARSMRSAAWPTTPSIGAGGGADAVPQLRERLRPCLRAATRCRSPPTARSPRGRALRAFRARCPRRCIEGFAWDAEGRRYDTLAELDAYAARVAGTVGAMMALLMGVRHAGRARAGLRSRRRHAAHQHRPRRRRGRPRRPPLSAARLAARGRHRRPTRGSRNPVFDDRRRRGGRGACSTAPSISTDAPGPASQSCRSRAGRASMRRGCSMPTSATRSRGEAATRCRSAPWCRDRARRCCSRARCSPSRRGRAGGRAGAARDAFLVDAAADAAAARARDPRRVRSDKARLGPRPVRAPRARDRLQRTA